MKSPRSIEPTTFGGSDTNKKGVSVAGGFGKEENDKSQNTEFGWKLPEIISSELSEGNNFREVVDRWQESLEPSTKISIVMALFVLGQRKLQISAGTDNMEKLRQLIKDEVSGVI